MWKLFAFLSAVFAAFTSIFAKYGMKSIDSTLATAIRTVVVLVLAWGIIFANGNIKGIKDLTVANWVFLVLSGLATGASWLCYFKAIQIGEVSRVAPIDKLSVVFTLILSCLILHEKITMKTALGSVLITVGSLLFL
ncbi:EamA family transporter [Treponema sp. OMZ 305]|uniref:EamA family transporter n=1 Tax=Treponema sp. OMZ 305 TaxID=1659192 RepID=UPI0020A34C36|nr:EamA family transporter [Treponema sp. OMZ 305]UTC57386.1 EamA family transporter [Treponema sp. OMZ 305]